MEEVMRRNSDETSTGILEPQEEMGNISPAQASTQKSIDPPRRGFWALAAASSASGAAAMLAIKTGAWISTVLLGSFLSTMAAGQRASMPLVSTNSPATAILDTAERYRQGVLNGDAAAVTSLFRDDAVEMGPFQEVVVGREAITKSYEGVFRSPVKITAFSFTHRDTFIHGDIAFDVGSYTRTMITPGGPIQAEGSYAVILKQNRDKWQIAYLIYNCNCMPPRVRDQALSAPR
jgi:uncharacterized protein (TIGR02246 family)